MEERDKLAALVQIAIAKLESMALGAELAGRTR